MKPKIILASILYLTLSVAVQAQQQTNAFSIFFDIDKSVVDGNNAKSLDKLVVDQNVTSIRIYGYTDFLGGTKYNQQLSEKRSENLRNYLIGKGVDKGIITLCKGEGIHPNSAKENRRDLSDKGIQAHRMVRVVYTTKTQAVSLKRNLSDEKIVAGNNILLENIIFYNNSDKFLSESYPTLKELFETMRKYPTLKIEIQGHICCSVEDSQEFTGKPLSSSRAEAVRDYLVENGIDSTRMIYKGFGSTRKRFPLEQNEHEMSMNRRVEILILEK